MDRHRIRNASASIGFVLATATAATGEPEYLGPTPYTSRADSPFDPAAFGFCVQDFESGVSLVAAGARLWPSGDLLEPGNLTDSVDEDDGVIDGSGTGGHSYQSGFDIFSLLLGLVAIEFDPYSRNGLPTEAGMVWTDGAATAGVVFQAYGPTGELLPGPRQPHYHADTSDTGETGEDRFYGVRYPKGIRAIELISTDNTPIEIDHFQFNRCVVCGDADNDLLVTASDALVALNVAIGLATCNPCLCDTTEDGAVNISDALRLLRRTVGWNSPVMRCPACDGW